MGGQRWWQAGIGPARARRLGLALLVVAGIVHGGLFVAGLFDSEASLRFDRTGQRMGSVRRLLGPEGATRWQVLRTRGVPGDYAWHALALAATGGALPGVVLLQLVLAGLAIYGVYRIGVRLDGRPGVALLAAGLYAVIPIDLAIPHFMASESFCNPLLVLGFAALVRYATGPPTLAAMGGAGTAFGLAALTRTESLPWLFVMTGFAAAIALRRVPARAGLHVGVLVLLTFGGVALWLAAAPSRPVDLDHASVSLSWELANRASRVIVAAGGDPRGVASAPLHSFLKAAVQHPVAFLREFALQAGKLLALPDNLDTFRFLGLYEYTGERADWVHELGVLGAARRVFGEMPWLASWLVASIGVWLGVLACSLRGAVRALRSSAGDARLVWWLLLSLPVVWTVLRVLTQGESRKRSPVDFAIALLAALGAMGVGPMAAEARAPTIPRSAEPHSGPVPRPNGRPPDRPAVPETPCP